MRMEIEKQDQAAIVKLRGEFLNEDNAVFRKQIDDAFSEQVRDFVIEAEDLTTLDSTAIETLMWLHETAIENLGQVRFVNPHHNVQQILTITRLADLFEIDESIENSLGNLKTV